MAQTIKHSRGHSLYPRQAFTEGELYLCVNPRDPALVFRDESNKFVVIRPNGSSSSSSGSDQPSDTPSGGGSGTTPSDTPTTPDVYYPPVGTYINQGTKTVEELNALTNLEPGSVYNVSNTGTLAHTIEGDNITIAAGANVVWTEQGWDILGGGTSCECKTFEGQSTENVGLIKSATSLDGMTAMEILEMMLKGHTQISISSVTSSSALKVDKDSSLVMTVTTKNCIDGTGKNYRTIDVSVDRTEGNPEITGLNTSWTASELVKAGKALSKITYTFVATSCHKNAETGLNEKSGSYSYTFTPNYPVILLNSDKDGISTDDVHILSDSYIYLDHKPTSTSDSNNLKITTEANKYIYLLVPKIWSVGNVNLKAGVGNTNFNDCTDKTVANTVNMPINVILNDGRTYEYVYYRTCYKQKAGTTYNFHF